MTRPYLVANMVVSADGRTTADGRVGALTGEEDQRLLYELRAGADAVLVGMHTVLAEGYGVLLPEDHAYPRAAAGRREQPLLAVVTSRPHDLAGQPALEDTRSDLLLLTDAEAVPAAARTVRRVAGAELRERIAGLGGEGVERVVCEGGPTLLGALLDRDLVDEFHLAVSPAVIGQNSALPLMRRTSRGTAHLLGHRRAGEFVFLHYGLDAA